MDKIAVVTGSFPPDKCGVGDYTYLLCNELSKNGFEVNVITSTDTSQKGKYNLYNNINEWKFKYIFNIFKDLSKINTKLVHIQYPTRAYGKKIMINFLPLFLKIKGYKVILTVHEYSDNSFLGKVRTVFTAIFSDSIIVVDQRYKIDMKKNFLLKKKDIEYVNIASNIPKATITEVEKDEKKQLILKGKNKKIMSYFGFIHERKGIEGILKAMKNLKDNEELNLVFLIIGELNESNEYHKNLLNQINELELQNDIIITGYLRENEVASYLTISDFVVLPFVDGFSPKNGSVLAALQEGKEVITTKSRYLEEEIDNLIFIDSYDNIKELTEKIRQKQRCRDTSLPNSNLNKFNWDFVAEKHYELYKKIKM